MFISGFLFKNRKFNDFNELKTFLIKKVKSLYFFYLKWELIFYSLTNLFFKIGFYTTNDNNYSTVIYPITTIKQYLFGAFKIVLGMGREPFCGAFWYIISLLFVIIGFSCARFLNNKYKRFEIVYVLICTILGWTMFYTKSIPRFSPALSLTLIFYLGNLNYRYSEKIKYDNLLIAVLSFFILILLNKFVSISLNINNIYNPIIYMLCSLSGLYLTFYLSKKIEITKISKVFTLIGKKTKAIMAGHLLSFKVAMIIQLYLGIISYEDLSLLKGKFVTGIWLIVYVIFGILIPIVLEYILKKVESI